MLSEHLSYSRIGTLLCPVKYYCSYILGFSVLSKYLVKGSLIHKYHEQNTLYGGDINKYLTRTIVEKDFDDEVDDFIKNRKYPAINMSRKDREEVVNDVLNIDYSRFYEILTNIQANMYDDSETSSVDVFYEQKIKYEFKGILKKFFKYMLIIPDVYLRSEKELVVIDIKTGNYAPEYDSQLYCYWYFLKKILSDVNIEKQRMMLYMTKTYSLNLISVDKNKPHMMVKSLLDLLREYLTKFMLYDNEHIIEFINDLYTSEKYREMFKETVMDNTKHLCKWCIMENFACPFKNPGLRADDILPILLNVYEDKLVNK